MMVVLLRNRFSATPSIRGLSSHTPFRFAPSTRISPILSPTPSNVQREKSTSPGCIRTPVRLNATATRGTVAPNPPLPALVSSCYCRCRPHRIPSLLLPLPLLLETALGLLAEPSSPCSGGSSDSKSIERYNLYHPLLPTANVEPAPGYGRGPPFPDRRKPPPISASYPRLSPLNSHCRDEWHIPRAPRWNSSFKHARNTGSNNPANGGETDRHSARSCRLRGPRKKIGKNRSPRSHGWEQQFGRWGSLEHAGNTGSDNPVVVRAYWGWGQSGPSFGRSVFASRPAKKNW